MKQSAFTLVELLVVLTIVGILLGLAADGRPFSGFWSLCYMAGGFFGGAVVAFFKHWRNSALALTAISLLLTGLAVPTVPLMRLDNYTFDAVHESHLETGTWLHQFCQNQTYGLPVSLYIEDPAFIHHKSRLEDSSVGTLPDLLRELRVRYDVHTYCHFWCGCCGGVGNPHRLRVYVATVPINEQSWFDREYPCLIDDRGVRDWSVELDDDNNDGSPGDTK